MKTYYEFACLDKYIKDEVIDDVFAAINMGVQGISVQLPILSYIADYIPDTFLLAAPIGYPNGYSLPKNSLNDAAKALDHGANTIDLVVKYYLYKNGRNKEFIDDLNSHYGLCTERNADLRLIIDHREFSQNDYVSLLKQIMRETAIRQLICANGTYKDEVLDNLVVAVHANKHSGMEVISNGNMYKNEDMRLVDIAIDKGNILGFRFHNINLMKHALSVYTKVKEVKES